MATIKNLSSKAAKLAYDEIHDLMNKESAKNWHEFVARFVEINSRFHENYELCEAYQVIKVGDKYQIQHGGRCGDYRPMDASTLYSWMCRLPLNYLAERADITRINILK